AGGRLTGRRYLMGDQITEADVRPLTTLVRFDAFHHGHFKCNRHRLIELPALWGDAGDLFSTPGFGETVDFDQIKRHHYVVHHDITTTGIVPQGPDLAAWLGDHGRAALIGSLPGQNAAWKLARDLRMRDDDTVRPGGD
ncbi:MAG: hypothetical protein ABIQ15_13835, partial [Nocardioides sp.]